MILASLPFFHSFGCTVTLWYPIIEGVQIVTYPSPLEAGKNAALVERYAVTVMFATPTFLRAYLRKVEPAELRSLRLVITGAEKLPADIARAFEERFGKHVYEGYGLTETSPVISVNLPDPVPPVAGVSVQPSSRAGSTGKMAPGIAAEIRDPETERKLSLHETGMLWVRGPKFSTAISMIRRDRRKCSRMDGSRRAIWGDSTKMVFSTSRGGSRASRRSAGRWCRTR